MGEHEPRNEKINRELSLKTKMLTGAAALGLLFAGAKATLDDITDLFDIKQQVGDAIDYIKPEIEHQESVQHTRPVTVVDIEPIDIHCVGVTTLEFSTTGKKEHKVFGKVFRTDTANIDASGDVLTCVEGDPLIFNTPSASTVIIDLADVKFIGQRIKFFNEELGELAGIDFDKGLIGDLTDTLPWVSDNETVTERTLAYAQDSFVSSECMQQTEGVTKQLIEIAYRTQAAAKGVEDISVEFIGEVDYSQLEFDTFEYQDDDYLFDVVDESVSCEILETADDQIEERQQNNTADTNPLASSVEENIEKLEAVEGLFS